MFKTADVVVLERNRGAENAILGAYDREGNLVEVGACSMIGKPDARPGDVAEVRYLYATPPTMRLYGPPNFVRVRDDKRAAECSIDQLVPVSRRAVTL